jgi:2-aminoadipate transaminase
LRDWICTQFEQLGLPVRRNNILIVSGAQQALDLIGRMLLDPGDKVLVENPTYLGLLAAWRPLGVQFMAMPSDEHGIQVDEIRPLLAQRPKLLYCIPNFQNPRGTTLTSGEALASLLELRSVNCPSGEFAGNVIYLGTFSKVIAPGLRVGWVVAPHEVVDKLAQAKQAVDLHTSTLCQHITFRLLVENFLEEHIGLLRHEYRHRRDVMLASLEKVFPNQVLWTRPEGGMFLMVSLPENIHAGDLLEKALRRQVAFVPGAEFHLEFKGQNTLRLNFSQVAPGLIQKGLWRLADALNDLAKP